MLKQQTAVHAWSLSGRVESVFSMHLISTYVQVLY